jgi:hypothetical protein
MIFKVQEGMVIGAEFLRPIGVRQAVVELDTLETAVLILDKDARVYRTREELRVEVTSVTPGSRDNRIEVRVTNKPLTRSAPSASVSPVRPVVRIATARPAPRAGATWDRKRIA